VPPPGASFHLPRPAHAEHERWIRFGEVVAEQSEGTWSRCCTPSSPLTHSSPLHPPPPPKGGVVGYILFSGGCALLLVSFLVSNSVFLAASLNNYPGGVALAKLHSTTALRPNHEQQHAVRADGVTDGARTPQNVPPKVHIDVTAAMTGITRFCELHEGSGWVYSKDEVGDGALAAMHRLQACFLSLSLSYLRPAAPSNFKRHVASAGPAPQYTMPLLCCATAHTAFVVLRHSTHCICCAASRHTLHLLCYVTAHTAFVVLRHSTHCICCAASRHTLHLLCCVTAHTAFVVLRHGTQYVSEPPSVWSFDPFP
jgi:hypothetical protein